MFRLAALTIQRSSTSNAIYSTPLHSLCVTSLARHFSSLSTSPSVSGENGSVIKFLTLNNISDNPGAKKKRKRVGRGVGSGRGKTCGRGHKGQKARSGGGPKPFFEGGQTPLHKVLPKRGFTNNHATPMEPLNLGTLQDAVDMGRLNIPSPTEDPLTIKDFVDAGLLNIRSVKHGVKLLAKGKERLRTPLRLEVSRASRGAIEALESCGGEVTTVHYNKLALRALLKPHKFDIIPRFAKPPPKFMPYYTNWETRGYLSAEVQKRKVLRRLKIKDGEGNTTETPSQP